LLAPKKTGSPDDVEGFDLSPSFRFLLAGGIAIVLGVGLTIYLATRNNAAGTSAASATTHASFGAREPDTSHAR
jgi:hypothetical protein